RYIGERRTPGRRRMPGQIDVVLDGERSAEERQPLARFPPLADGPRLSEQLVAGDDMSPDSRVRVGRDALEDQGDDVLGRGPSVIVELSEAPEVQARADRRWRHWR